MYHCDKCGEIVDNVDIPCPTCGMSVFSRVDLVKNKSNNLKFKVLIFLIIIIGSVIGAFSFYSINNYDNKEIKFSGKNYFIHYQGDNWKESDLSSDEYLVLQNNDDLNAFLQIPISATELNLNIENSYDRENLYDTFAYLLRNDNDYNYHNLTSGFVSLDNTDNYCMSSEFYKYSDPSLKGKVFIVVSPQGKVINILLKKGTKSIASIEKDVYELLKSIEI